MTTRAKRLNRKSTVRRKRDPIPWKYCLLTLICGLFLVAGFFYAARQHFSSMSIGMENAELRTKVKKLESLQRNLKLKKEISLSPAEIKKAAIKLGMQARTARNIEISKNDDPVENDSENKKALSDKKVEPKKKEQDLKIEDKKINSTDNKKVKTKKTSQKSTVEDNKKETGTKRKSKNGK